MAIPVLIPTAFKKHTGGEGRTEVEAGSVREMLNILFERYPAMRPAVMERDHLHRHVNIFINGLDSRFIGGLDSPLAEGDEVQLVVAIAGG